MFSGEQLAEYLRALHCVRCAAVCQASFAEEGCQLFRLTFAEFFEALHKANVVIVIAAGEDCVELTQQ